MDAKSTGFALLVLIIPCLAVWGPPPGSRGTIDFRYPDYIVDPKPPCLSEGVFPHPRNCSWYYRCHDPYEIGFYHTNYFECEPGTVFSDELDQCIHPFNPTYPCQPGVTTTPTTPKPSDVCFNNMIRCKTYLCPLETGGWESIGRLCEIAFSLCKNGTKTYYCDSPQYFEVLTRKCVQPPGEKNCVDKEEFDSTASPPPTTTTTTTTTTTVLPDDCYYSMIECHDYQCSDSIKKEYLCKKAYWACNSNKHKLFFICTSDYYYNFNTKKCVQSPSARGCILVDKTATPGTTTETIDSSLINFNFTVECSAENRRPREPQLSQYYCSNYKSCEAQGPAEIELCWKYLQCIPEGKLWKIEVAYCAPGLLFSYDGDKCVKKPEENCKRI